MALDTSGSLSDGVLAAVQHLKGRHSFFFPHATEHSNLSSADATRMSLPTAVVDRRERKSLHAIEDPLSKARNTMSGACSTMD